MTANALTLKDIRKQYDDPEGSGQITVLDDVSLEVPDESFTTIMGPSGCGKSTTLNILAGIETPDSGTIEHDGAEVAPGDYHFGYVFQEPRLLNWRNVEQNLEFALNAHDVPESEHAERIERWLDKVGMRSDQQNYPLRLSGGMRQRIGLCRAMVVDPDILLMDEPFSALDELTARELRRDLIDIWEDQQKTVVFVTHDISEAVYLSDQILFMNQEGKIFERANIDVERPREFEDPELQEIETELMRKFFGTLEV